MSQKSEKKLRRTQRKFNKHVFTDFMVEVGAMRFRKRLWFCLKMAFNSHEIQVSLKDNIKAKRAAFKEAGIY